MPDAARDDVVLHRDAQPVRHLDDPSCDTRPDHCIHAQGAPHGGQTEIALGLNDIEACIARAAIASKPALRKRAAIASASRVGLGGLSTLA